MQTHQLDARIRRLLTELAGLTVRKSIPVGGIEISEHGKLERLPFQSGDTWGKNGEWWDFFCHVSIPHGFSGRVCLSIRTGYEELWEATCPQFVVWINGHIEQAFDTKHTSLTLQKEALPYSSFDVMLNAYACIPGAEHLKQKPPILELVLQDINEPLCQMVYDIRVPYEAAVLLPEGDRERETTLQTLSAALDRLDLRRPHSEAFDASVADARAFLKKTFYDRRRLFEPIAIAECVGHTHIDVAWLWDLYQTRHKAVRSFATVLKLMELYPEYTFMSSQAALYKMVKEDQPELFSRIREAVREGRWEAEGGMWVEADCNISGGESLARQFLHGQTFFQREFGKKSRILWLPDVFGYSAALPQLMLQSGIDYFMTTKLSWSEFNLSPYDTFLWKGIDGSEVLTHFSPTRDFTAGDETGHEGLQHYTTYNAQINPSQLKGGWQRFQQKGLDDHFLVTYGYGDGGGGPTDWMLENARRMTVALPGVPAIRHTFARDFFEALEDRVAASPNIPKWSGELYLEYHRGTYTAMARNKRDNRKMEIMLRDVELWSVYAEKLCGITYPKDALYDIWEDLLTLQFHDILPGSSIQKVYDDSAEIYARRFRELEMLRNTAIQALSQRSHGDLLAFNSLSHMRDDLIWFAAPTHVRAVRNAEGAVFPVQHVEGRACAFVRGMQPMAVTPLWFVRDDVSPQYLRIDNKGFETPLLRGTFDRAMRITSLIDKTTGRQVAKPGEALNRIVCYENKPHNYDAWDINIYYNRRRFEVDHVVSADVVTVGPVLAMLRVAYQYQSSTITQEITVYRDIKCVDFHTTVDWKEAQYMLKAHFPVDVFYNEATYDIQYGNVRRPTHKNTSWDIARFEVCAHKWADVSEDGYGVSLLNDCKYGHSIDEDGMALTLLKSSIHPSPKADQEVHAFTYALLPHDGGWRESGTVDAAYALNIPVLAVPGNSGVETVESLASVEAKNIVIESVKKAQNGDGYIIRLYECFGRRTKAALELGFAPKMVHACNILEETAESVAVDGKRIEFEIAPYEIRSFWVE